MGLKGIEQLRAEQDRRLAQLDATATSRRLLASPPTRSRRRSWMVGLAAAALVLVVAGLLLRPRGLAFTVDGHAGDEGAWVAAPAGEHNVKLRFSEGSEFELQPNASLRVGRIDDHGAELVVERGRLMASVTPLTSAHWTLHLGPYTITVLGTRFEVSWQPEREHLSVALFSGSIRIAGPDTAPIELKAGQQIEIDKPTGAVNIAPLEAPVVPPTETPTPPTTASAEPSATSMPSSVAAPPSSWRKLAEEGRYQQAHAAAETVGFDALLERTDATGVALLTDAARFANRPDQARRALLVSRRRFPGPAAAQAAFLLGRMSFASAPAEAATWFATYLAELPAGPLAREASGRLFEAREQAGDHEGARALAAQYLARYPTGPHAVLARRLVENSP